MRVLMTGATGYLGTTMREYVPAGVEMIATGYSRSSESHGVEPLDVTDALAVRNAVERHRPDVVVHLAAVSVVASAAADPGAATAVNATGARTVAEAAGRAGVRLVAMSSDVVFDGRSGPYAEDAVPHPINEYGASKLAAEEAIVAAHPGSLVLRTSVLVGRDRADRHPFSAFVLERARAGNEIRLFENERRNFYPVTCAAAAVWECAGSDVTGFLHLGATTSASRFEFGQRLLKAAGCDPSLATPVRGPSHRPSDLTLIVDRARSQLATPMPTMDEVVVEVRRDLQLT